MNGVGGEARQAATYGDGCDAGSRHGFKGEAGMRSRVCTACIFA